MLPTETEGIVDDDRDAESSFGASTSSSAGKRPEPPIKEGEIRTVTIDTLGDQGDGITHVERGFVVIVADAEPDEKLTIGIY